MSTGLRLRVLDAVYWLSAARGDGLPAAPAPEFAFVGRSNVGKSSLLNTMMDKRGLVRTSKTPGQTRNVNLFKVTLGRVGHSGAVSEKRDVVFADLPGYGYAKVPAGEKARLGKLLSTYLTARDGLVCVVQLVDARHVATKDDKEMLEGLNEGGRKSLLVATKIDRVAPAKRKLHIKKLVEPLGVAPTTVLAFSSTERIGRDALLEHIWDLSA